MSINAASVIESAISARVIWRSRRQPRSSSLACQGIWDSRFGVRFDSSARQSGWRNGESGQPFSFMTPNGNALAPMIPAMEHRVFSALTIALVAGVALLLVLYGLWAVLMLIAGYLPD